LALRGFDPENDKYNFHFVYQHRAELRHSRQASE
jgi:hypothetical protein